MNKKALVTGATGFIGSSLVRGLINNGWEVDVVVRPSSSLNLLLDMKEKIKVHHFDGDTSGLITIVAQSRPDVVFHVASLFLSEHMPEQVETLIQSNILFGIQLLEAMAEAGVQRLVNTSTSWEHFENREYSPVNLYAATKKAFSDVLQYYVEARNICAITLELFDTYGLNDPRPKLLNLLKKIAETGESLSMSPGEQKIDLVHINDVVQAYLVAAQRLLDTKVKGHKTYGVGSGNPMSLKELVALLEKHIGKEININWGGRAYRAREVMEPWSATMLPNWEAKISLREGLKGNSYCA